MYKQNMRYVLFILSVFFLISCGQSKADIANAKADSVDAEKVWKADHTTVTVKQALQMADSVFKTDSFTKK